MLWQFIMRGNFESNKIASNSSNDPLVWLWYCGILEQLAEEAIMLGNLLL